jgi:hypothetical protein
MGSKQVIPCSKGARTEDAKEVVKHVDPVLNGLLSLNNADNEKAISSTISLQGTVFLNVDEHKHF